MAGQLLTRDDFRKLVFQRDLYRCVICKITAVDAHHIIERRLFPDGGYYLDNGASLCKRHHIEAETTTLSCEAVRIAAKIDSVVLPPRLYPDSRYDKWGNPYLDNGQRIKGELFYDESVQKILKVGHVLVEFTDRMKYPRTWHLPWSPGFTKDDRVLDQAVVDSWAETEVVITERMDGENTTMYSDYLHARSIDYSSHPSRDRIKALHSQIAHDIPDGWRICGENLVAVHSIQYHKLPALFLAFSMWDRDKCMGWDETVTYCKLLGLHTVPVLARGILGKICDETFLKTLSRRCVQQNPPLMEGYVIRPASSFTYNEFPLRVGKYVRRNHVQTHGHWMRQRLEYNEIAG